jgi:hypothetical protein
VRLDRTRAKLKEIKEGLRRRMHQPIPEQGVWLKQVVAGNFNYHAVPTNGRALSSFRIEAARRWQQVLGRRSQNGAIEWCYLLRARSSTSKILPDKIVVGLLPMTLRTCSASRLESRVQLTMVWAPRIGGNRPGLTATFGCAHSAATQHSSTGKLIPIAQVRSQ